MAKIELNIARREAGDLSAQGNIVKGEGSAQSTCSSTSKKRGPERLGPSILSEEELGLTMTTRIAVNAFRARCLARAGSGS